MSRDPKLISEAATESGGCINYDIIKAHTSERGTFYLVAFDKDKPIGYSRLFMTKKAEDSQPILAIDTMEVGHKQFTENTDKVRAMGLAINQLCLDANVQTAIGIDARVKYGYSDGFKNKTISNLKIIRVGSPKFQLYNT